MCTVNRNHSADIVALNTLDYTILQCFTALFGDSNPTPCKNKLLWCKELRILPTCTVYNMCTTCEVFHGRIESKAGTVHFVP